MENKKLQLNVEELTDTNIPDGEVIGLNMYGDALVGYIYYAEDEQKFICESDESMFTGVTHFIRIPNYGHN